MPPLSPIAERNLTLALCAAFTLSAFGYARIEPLYWAGIVGWLLGALQSLRLYGLRVDPNRRPRGQAMDIVLTMLTTIFVVSTVYALFLFARSTEVRAPRGWVELQNAAFAAVVALGGWALAWLQGVRRLRLNVRYMTGQEE